MKLYIIIFILITCLAPQVSMAGNVENRVATLREACEKARSLSQYESLEQHAAELIREAKKTNDVNAETFACFYSGLAKLFMGQTDESLKMLDKAGLLADNHGNDSVKALVMNTMGIYHALMENNKFVAQQYFFKSLDLAGSVGYEDLQYRVRGNLLTLSHSTGGDMVLENAQKVYDYGQKHQNYEQQAMGSYYLATYYFEHDDYEKVEKYLKIALKVYEKYPYEDIASVYSLYTKMLLSRGDVSEAEEMVKRSIELSMNYHQTSMEVDARITYAEVMAQQRRYQESTDMILKALATAQDVGMESKAIDCNQIMASNFLAMNRVEEAVKCLQEVNARLKKQTAINMEQLAHEQQIMHDIEQKEMEAKLNQEQIRSQRNLLIASSLTIVVLLILLISIILSYRKRQLLYRKIVLQNTRSLARQKGLEQQIEVLSLENEKLLEQRNGVTDSEVTAVRETPAIDDDKVNYLYGEICRMMDGERLYAEPQLTRERMAELLGTNRTYLTRVIKEKTGMNYLQFINSYRINEAIRILSDKDKVNYPLKQIWSDLGFSSPSTFFKLFQQTVGITPSVYRKQFLQVNEEDSRMGEEEDGV